MNDRRVPRYDVADHGDAKQWDKPADYDFVKLRFFRDLFEVERVKLLVEFGNIPAGAVDEIKTRAAQRAVFKWIARNGNFRKMVEVMSAIIKERELDPYSPWPGQTSCPHLSIKFEQEGRPMCATCGETIKEWRCIANPVTGQFHYSAKDSEGIVYERPASDEPIDARLAAFRETQERFRVMDEMQSKMPRPPSNWDEDGDRGTYTVVRDEKGDVIESLYLTATPIEGQEIILTRKEEAESGTKMTICIAYKILKVRHIKTKSYDGKWQRQAIDMEVKSIEDEI